MAVYLDVDLSDVQQRIDFLEKILTREKFRQLMQRTFTKAGRKVKKIMKDDLPQEYHVKKKDVGAAVRAPILGGDEGDEAGCSIPIVSIRGPIGGHMFTASGAAPGWKVRKYRVKARIYRSERSTLPKTMHQYGGFPPFRNSRAPQLNGVAFTRVSKKRLPIQKIVGIAIPQMPLNKSEDTVQEDIKKVVQENLELEFARMFQ